MELKESLNVLDNFNNRWDEEEKLVKMMKQRLQTKDQEMKLYELQKLEDQIRKRVYNTQSSKKSSYSSNLRSEKYSPKMRFNQVMSERRKNQRIEYDTNIDVISKRNSEPVYMSPKSSRSGAYSQISQTKSFQSAKEYIQNKIQKPLFNDNLYQSYIQSKSIKKR